MEIGYTPEQEALRLELRTYYDNLLDEKTVEALSHSHGIGQATKDVWKQMCTDGWAGIGWPKEYGGQARGPIDQFVFFDESMRAGAPVPMLTLNTVGPTIMNYGTDWQKEFFLPQILAGDIHFCIGYSEPGAGTDLAALQTRAVRDGDEYVINGQKMWTSLAGGADYCWLAVRTDPEAKKHKGISVIIVPMDTPGITIQPLRLMGEHDINATYFDDVRVPAKFLVGEENGGWGLITNQLNHERVTLCSSGMPERHLANVREWAQNTMLPDGRRVIDQEWVQVNLAKVHAKLEYLRLANWKVAWSADHEKLHPADASSVKVFGTEFYLDSYQLLMEVLGPRAYLDADAPESILRSQLEAGIRGTIILTFGGGTNELQRDLIAMFGLGFPPFGSLSRKNTHMDFSFTSDQEELRGLVNRVLTDRCTMEHLKEVEDGEGVDLALWRELADLGIVGIGMPESDGGAGLGFAEVGIVLEEVGRTVAQVPALPVMGMAAPFLAEHAPSHLAGLASGERIITVALHELVGDVHTPYLSAAGGSLTGVKTNVPFGTVADGFLVSAADGIYFVDAKAAGVTVERQDATDGIPDAKVTFSGASAEKLAGIDALDRLLEYGQTSQSLIMAGVTAKAVEIMSEYVKERVQFDRQIATFQAVAQRAADCRIDSEAIKLTAWAAMMRLNDGLSAGENAASAKYWASEGGARVVRACTHLHGGVGVDRDYPLHRYYLWAKKQELFLGGATQSLLHLGKLLADTPV